MDKFTELIGGPAPTLVDFHARWCGPCRTMQPVLEELKKTVGDKARIVKIDVDADRNRSLAARYNVRSVPTLILFRGGEAVWRHTGAADLETLRQAIDGAR